MRHATAAMPTPCAPSALVTAAATIERDWPMDGSQLESLLADLRHSDARTRFALGVAKTGVWEAELFTGQVEWSDTMHLAMGRTAAAFDGTLDGMRSLLHPEDRDKFARVIHGNFDAPRDFQVEVRIPWPDGVVHHVQLRGRIAPDPGGMSVRLVSVAQDVTEQSLLEGRLRQAQKMEAMGRLAGGVAHDFNNILTAILGYAVLIEGEPGDAASNETHAVQIRRAAERATVLTKQLLAFSRRQVVERRTVHLNDVFDDLLPMLGKILGEQIAIDQRVDVNTYPVFADAGQLQQVVLNLAINARDAMPDGGHLTLSAGNVTLTDADRVPRFKMAAGEYVLLTVTDTGTGMDASTRTQIFEPFFTTKSEGQGTGLGLSTVFEIVKGLGGGIRVSSEPGDGTTFRIYLPRTEMAAGGAAVPSTATLIGGSETVLVVEDEEAVRLLVTDILGRKGYTVLTAADATQARAIASGSEKPIDIVLTDVMMPDGTGPDLIESLRAGAASGVRALYMSGYAGAALARQGKMAGDCEFLQKPFTGQQLLAKIRHLLDISAVPATSR